MVAISAPRFGACFYQAQTQQPVCALMPSNCPEGTSYMGPREILTLKISCKADDVSVGRCTSSLDDNRCAVDSDSCSIQNKFNRKSDACTLFGDHAEGSSASFYQTMFPSCRDKISNQKRCVLSQNDCTQSEQRSQPMELPWADKCFCHHVSTGLCYNKSTLAAEDSLCAMTSKECDTDQEFMTALELMKMPNPPRKCRLCKEGDGGKGPRIVETGGCYETTSNNFQSCAFESTDCSASQYFRSTIQMNEIGDVSCQSPSMVVGRCTSSLEDICTNSAESCKFQHKFEKESSCIITDDKQNGKPTYYPVCKDNSNYKLFDCVWSDSDCEGNITDGSRFEPAREPESWFSSCECSDVKLGACLYKGEYHCAVSQYACDDPSTFLSFRQLESSDDLDLKCRLCKPRERGVPTHFPTTQAAFALFEERGKSVPVPTHFPTTQADFGMFEDREKSVPSSSATLESSAGDSRRNSEIVGAVFGVLVFALVLLLISFGYRSGRNVVGGHNSTNSNKEEAVNARSII